MKLYPIRKNGKEGFIDASGEIRITPKFDFVKAFSGSTASVAIYDNECPYKKCPKLFLKKIFKDYKGCTLPDCEYLPKKWGYIDEYGEWLAEPQFDYAPSFGVWDDIVPVIKNGKWGFITQIYDFNRISLRRIVLVLEATFEDAEPLVSDDFACVKKDGKWGYINFSPITRTANHAIPPKYDDAFNFSEGLARVMVDGYRDPKYDDPNIHWFIKPNLQGKWGFIDETGKFVINPQFDYAGNFKEGLALVMINEKYGYSDKTGFLTIKPQFDSASYFSEELAVVEINGKYGFINKTGNFVVEPIFDNAQMFTDGIAIIKINDKYHYLTKESLPSTFLSKIFLKYKRGFDHAEQFKEGLAVIKKNGKYGYINKKGKYVIRPKFEKAHSFIGEVAPVCLNNKFHYINKKGDIIWTNEQFPLIWHQSFQEFAAKE
jgi:hypothetical protein